MTARGAAVAAVVALLAISAVVVFEVLVPRARQRRLDRVELLLPADATIDTLGEIVIETPQDRLRLAPSGGDRWRLEAKGVDRELVADSRALELVVRALAGARIQDVGDADDVEDLAGHGLSPPGVKLAWTARGAEPRQLELGAPTLDGTRTHALHEGRLVTVPAAIFEAVRWDAGHFRQKTLVSVAWDDVTRIEIVRRTAGAGATADGAHEDRLVLSRDPHPAGDPRSWRLVEPVDAPANDARIGSIVSKLSPLLSAGFGSERPDEAELAAKGLAPALVTLTVMTAQGAPLVMEIGGEGERPDTAWAKVPDQPLTMIRRDLRDDLLLDAVYLRDARAFPAPRWGLRNVRLSKGLQAEVHLEIQNEADEGWRAVRPADAALPREDVVRFLDALGDVLVGRFEDELAREPGMGEPPFQFHGPGSFLLQGSSAMEDGRELTVVTEVGTPFAVRRDRYVPVRTTDNARRVQVLITKHDAFDSALRKARALADAAASAGTSAATPAGPAGTTQGAEDRPPAP